jgi:anti-sigma B factor antagonist
MDIVLPMAVVECARYVLAMPRGEIDAYNEPVFRQQLFDAVGDRPLIIDMTEVSFLDCSALNAVIAADRLCREHGADLAVAGLRPAAEQVFRLAGAAEIVPLCPTVQDAVWCVVPLTDEEIASWN